MSLAALPQRIGRAGQHATVPAVSIVFVESKHFLPDDIASQLNSPFSQYTTGVGHDSELAGDIISKLYEDSLPMKKEKAPTPYHAVNPALLWFINTDGCRRRLALAYPACQSAFRKIRTTLGLWYSSQTSNDPLGQSSSRF